MSVTPPNPFWIDYLVSRSPAENQFVIGSRALLVAEARAFNPPADKFTRSDAKWARGFESTVLRRWEEISISVRGITNGWRDVASDDNLSLLYDYKQFIQSAADGQRMVLDASNIGGVPNLMYVKLISTTNELRRQKTKQKYDVTFRLEVVA